LIDGEEAVGTAPLFRKLAYVPQELDLFDHMSGRGKSIYAL